MVFVIFLIKNTLCAYCPRLGALDIFIPVLNLNIQLLINNNVYDERTAESEKKMRNNKWFLYKIMSTSDIIIIIYDYMKLLPFFFCPLWLRIILLLFCIIIYNNNFYVLPLTCILIFFQYMYLLFTYFTYYILLHYDYII